MMNDILDALDVIKDKMPNGEIKSIQDKIENIESAQEDMHEDLRQIKKQLLDPEDGIVVRVNKNTEFRKRKEASEKTFQAIIDEHKELMSWKSTVTKILWILFTAVAGILVSIVFKSMPN
jgi:predicted  nucleic acid-binding Zn-ribbon protein